MSRKTITFLSVVPIMVVLFAIFGVLFPKRSGKEIPLVPPLSAEGRSASGGQKGDERGIFPQVRARVRVGSTDLSVEIADTPSLRKQGLSGHAPLHDDQGMLFIFPVPTTPAFWMLDMKFPLDMVWIGADKKVADITTHVPAPAPGTLNSALPTYSPKVPVVYVLEVNAGWAEKHGVKVGDSVTW